MNNILDYEQVIEKLQKIISNGKMQENKPIGYSTFGLPISHYTYGNGQNNIVISGATHGCELISTDLVLRLMEAIPNYINIQNYTIHFFPMINPEGYLISTSAVRKIIPRDMENEQAQTIIDNYVKNYNAHDFSYQNTFANVDYTCISEKYEGLRNSVKQICENNNVPKGTLQVWSSNGNGIDLNQNCPYNKKMEYLRNNETLYGNKSYGNILVTKPGPIGCPSKTAEFQYEPETKCFRDFLLDLKHHKTLCAYMNYHSAEDTIFYKPLLGVKTPEILTNIDATTKYNEEISNIYASNTTQKLYNRDTTFCCFNDMLRLEIPGDILIELSPNEGNPLSAYSNYVYQKTIKDNLIAAIYTIQKIPEIYKQYKNQINARNIIER